jgi:hypothetical protein
MTKKKSDKVAILEAALARYDQRSHLGGGEARWFEREVEWAKENITPSPEAPHWENLIRLTAEIDRSAKSLQDRIDADAAERDAKAKAEAEARAAREAQREADYNRRLVAAGLLPS